MNCPKCRRKNMNLITIIKNSEWWGRAEQMSDRHYEPSAGISLADHLMAVCQNLRFLHPSDGTHEYFHMLRQAVTNVGLNLIEVCNILTPVALLHDIGKTREDKDVEITHPLTGKLIKKRHPIVSVSAALDLIPNDIQNRDIIFTLIEEHDTPYSWYMQFKRTGQIPKRKSWAKLDRKIDQRGDGIGLILLFLFKIADIDGHGNAEDVPWFIDQSNIIYLREKGKCLPVPDVDAIRALSNISI